MSDVFDRPAIESEMQQFEAESRRCAFCQVFDSAPGRTYCDDQCRRCQQILEKLDKSSEAGESK